MMASDTPSRVERYVRAAVLKQAERLKAVVPGERSGAVLSSAFSIGRLTHLGAVPEAEIVDALFEAIAHVGFDHSFTERDARKTIRRGLRNGARSPRGVSLGTASADRPARRPPPPRPATPPAHPRPLLSEVLFLWEVARPVTTDEHVADWLWYRGFDPDQIAARDLCRALPHGAPLPRWARTQGGTWTQTGHRCLFPVVDATGRLASVRARCVRPDVARAEKAFPPSGYPVRGLVLADEAAVQVLQGAARPLEVLVAEGETDYLRATLSRSARPVFGVVAGAWDPTLTSRIPVGTVALVATDTDGSGNGYAAALRATLGARCHLRRIRVSQEVRHERA